MSIGFTRPGLRPTLFNHDKAFASLTKPPVIANDFDISDPEQYELFRNALTTQFNGECIDNYASCACGDIKGSYNIGFVCTNCGEQVVSEHSNDIESSLWIRAPEGIPGLILPELWIKLSSILNMSYFNYFLWLIDKSYKPVQVSNTAATVQTNQIMEERFGKHRGLIYFIKHFDEIIEFICENTRIVAKKDIPDLLEFIDRYRDCFFPKHLAAPSNLVFVVENLDNGRYVDFDLNPGVDAIVLSSQISKYEESGQTSNVEKRTVKMLANFTAFVEKYFMTMGKKPGDYRKNVYGSRLNLTARAVITSIPDRCEVDDIRIPYGVTVQLFKYHIASYLRKRHKYTANECIEFVETYTARQHPLMLEILDEIFSKANGGRGPCVLFCRNPSLRRGSTQRFFAQYKKDINDETISLPPTALKEENADFDGDEMNLLLLPDGFLTTLAEPLAPAHWVRSIEKPRDLNNSLVMQVPVIETIHNWLNDDYLKK